MVKRARSRPAPWLGRQDTDRPPLPYHALAETAGRTTRRTHRGATSSRLLNERRPDTSVLARARSSQYLYSGESRSGQSEQATRRRGQVSIDPYIVLGSAVVGFLVGLTGAGGGALMTPMLILLFGIKPSAAISSDLVAAVVMRPVGAVVHLYKGTVNLRLVGWMVVGSVPAAFFGAYVLHLLGSSKAAENNVEIALGAALLLGAMAMVVRSLLDRRSGEARTGVVHEVVVRPLPTILIGAVGGIIVGMTSVGSGSLMIVLLLFLYPLLGANQLVGTDLTQAVPLTLAAALGALAFGHVEFAVTTSIVIGSVPAVFVGAFLSSHAPDRFIRPAITFVIFASGLKYVGLGTTALGWVLCATLLAAGAIWLAYLRPWQASRSASSASSSASSASSSASGASSARGGVLEPNPPGGATSAAAGGGRNQRR